MAARLEGLYLVVNPAPGTDAVLEKVDAAIRGGVSVLQVWNNWGADQDPTAFVQAAIALAQPHGVPVLVHERPDLLATTAADGIHYDTATLTPAEIRASAGRRVLYGITAGNNLGRVHWARLEGADYVSFCSVFASPSAGVCELVDLETISAARRLGGIAIFASGGITPENTGRVIGAGANGVAVISGILGADDPEAAARRYRAAIVAHGGGTAGP